METEHLSGQSGASPAAEADLACTIEQLPSHMRLMVLLLAQTVSPSVDKRMTKKRGKVALEQVATMKVAVTHSSFREILLTFPGIMSLLIVFSLFNAGRYDGWLGSPRLLEAPQPG